MRQSWSLVADAIVAAEVVRMMGDACDPAATVTVADLIAKYRLDWGTYRQGAKHRSAAAQHLRTALRCNPHLTVTGDRNGRFTVYRLKDPR